MRCKTDMCGNASWAKGFCAKHYYHAQRHGLLPRPPCSVEGCESPSFRKGMCNAHHLRTKKYGSPDVRKKAANGECNAPCVVDGCDRRQKGKSLCSTHLGRLRHHGDPLAAPKKLANGTATSERKKENAARAMKRYHATPHGKLRSRYNTAKRRVLAGKESSHISKAEFLKLWNSPLCGICVAPVSDADKSIDHKIPLSRGGTNDIPNMQIAHLICNQRKSANMVAA